MKKLLSILLAIAMLVSCMVALTACGDKDDDKKTKEEKTSQASKVDVDDKAAALAPGATNPTPEANMTDAQKIVGTWKTNVKIGDVAAAAMGEGTEEMAAYFDMDSITMPMNFTFGADNTVKINVDTEKFLGDFKVIMKDGMKKLLEESLAGSGMTLDEALAEQGTTLDGLVDEAMKEIDTNDIINLGVGENGTYKLEGGKIISTADGEQEAFTYSFQDNNTLIFHSIEAEAQDENQAAVKATFPWTLTRVS